MTSDQREKERDLASAGAQTAAGGEIQKARVGADNSEVVMKKIEAAPQTDPLSVHVTNRVSHSGSTAVMYVNSTWLYFFPSVVHLKFKVYVSRSCNKTNHSFDLQDLGIN